MRSCEKIIDCGFAEEVFEEENFSKSDCESYADSAENDLKGLSSACLGAYTDFYNCYARLSCDDIEKLGTDEESDECDPFQKDANEKCPEL